jgi:hypothetical protein
MKLLHVVLSIFTLGAAAFPAASRSRIHTAPIQAPFNPFESLHVHLPGNVKWERRGKIDHCGTFKHWKWLNIFSEPMRDDGLVAPPPGPKPPAKPMAEQDMHPPDPKPAAKPMARQLTSLTSAPVSAGNRSTNSTARPDPTSPARRPTKLTNSTASASHKPEPSGIDGTRVGKHVWY